MIGLFFISLICAIAGIIVAITFNTYENYKGSMISLIIGFAFAVFGWTICWMYDNPQEILARLKYDHVKTMYVSEKSLDDYGIDLKKSNIIYATTVDSCKSHGSHRCKCNNHCEYEKMQYIIIGENDNDTYDKITSTNY